MPVNVQIIDEDYTPFQDETNRTRGECKDGVVHMTDIISSLDQRDYTGVKWNMPVTADCGFIWERALERAYKDKLGIRVGEVVVDDIICSPDGMGDDPLGLVPCVDEEYKLTWKSSRSPIEDNWYYMTQFKGYCYALGTTVTVARVLYVMGNYKGSGPQYKVYRIEFDDVEIRANWRYLRTHAEQLGWVTGR